MRYEDINWNNVSSAVATEHGLQLTYRTPQVGVGQTQSVPLELQGTPEQAAEFNARFLGQGRGSAEFDARFGSTVALFNQSPPGSYGQMPNMPAFNGPACASIAVSLQAIQNIVTYLQAAKAQLIAGGAPQATIDHLNSLLEGHGASYTSLLQFAKSIGCETLTRSGIS